MLLVLNKYDIVEENMKSGLKLQEHETQQFMSSFSQENGFLNGVTASAKTGNGVTEAVAELVQKILQDEMKKMPSTTEVNQTQEVPNSQNSFHLTNEFQN